jgi:hypothetical protein
VLDAVMAEVRLAGQRVLQGRPDQFHATQVPERLIRRIEAHQTGLPLAASSAQGQAREKCFPTMPPNLLANPCSCDPGRWSVLKLHRSGPDACPQCGPLSSLNHGL